MGTSCTVAVTAEPRGAPDARRALAAARVEVAACERALSRFDASSDLSRLNRAAGSWVDVDARLIEALEAAVRGRIDTWGLFDPSILPVLEAAGYDRSFEQLVERDARSVEGWRADARIDVDPEAGRARIARRAAVDLGGLGKGFAATRAVRAMRAESPALVGALVDLGGDIAVCGVPPEDGPWRIDVDDPRSPGSVLGVLELTDGGVATSGRNTRRFGPGRKLHHLIDPTSGMPAAAGPLAVTVAAASATEAEIYATSLAIAEVGRARELLASRPDVSALLVPTVGAPVVVGRLPIARSRPAARLVVNTQPGRFAWQ